MKRIFIFSLIFLSYGYAQDTSNVVATDIVSTLQSALKQAETLLENQQSSKDKLDTLQAQNNTLQVQLEDIQTQLATLQAAHAQTKSELEQANLSHASLKQEADTLAQERDDLSNKLQAEQAKNAENTQALRDAQNALKTSQNEVATLVSEVAEAEALSSQLRNDYSTVKAERDSMDTVRQSFLAAEEELRARIVTLQQERDAFEAQAQDLQGDLNRAQQAQVASQSEISALQADAAKGQELEGAQARIAELESQMAQQSEIAQGDIETLRGQVLSMRDLLEKAEAQVASLTTERDALQKTLDTQANSDVRLARDVVFDVQTRISSLQKQINTSGGATAEQVSQLEGLRAEFAQAQEGMVRAINGTAAHTVRSGETLSTIAARYYGDGGRWRDILEANTYWIDSQDDIRPGDVLVIP